VDEYGKTVIHPSTEGSTMTTTTRTDDLANVPHPVGAVEVHEWYNPDQPIGAVPTQIRPDTARYFRGTIRSVSRPDSADIGVYIDGTQYADGRVDRSVGVVGIDR
jgi:hypothetical protein